MAQVESATGYRVRVDGPVKITVFPSIDLVAREVGIAEPSAGGPAEFATARTLKLGLKLGGLLSGKVQLTEVELVDPVITLPLPEEAARDAGAPDEGKAGAASRGFSLDTLTIRNGTVVLRSEDGAQGSRITELKGEAALPRANGPLTFDATARYDGDPVSAKGSIGSLRHFLEGGTVPVNVALNSADLPGGIVLKGAASYKESVLTLAQFTAQSGAHKLSGNATYGDDTLKVAQGVFDDMPFAGTVHLAGDTLTVDLQATVEDKPVRVAGSLGAFDNFLAGGEAPAALAVVAPEHLPDEVRLDGVISYKDDILSLPRFKAVSGEDTVAGAATYKDNALSLNGITAVFGSRTVSGNAIYRDDAVDLAITTDVKGKPAKISGTLANVEKLLAGEPARIDLVVDAPDSLPAKASLKGNALYRDDTLVLTGLTAVSGDYTLLGDGTYRNEVLTLDPVKLETGSQTVSGTLSANLAGEIPAVTATLSATGRSAGAPSTSIPEQETAAPSTDAKPPPADAAANPLARLPGETEIAVAPPAAPAPEQGQAAPEPQLAREAPEARGIGWRAQKFGLLALKDVDADIALALNQVVVEDIRIGSATVKAVLANGKLTVQSQDLKAYGGSGTLNLTLDASGGVPSHNLDLSATGLDAHRMLRDVADFSTIQGKAAIALKLSASGDTESAMVSSLGGTANFEFTDGALRGLNVASMLRNLTTGILTGWQYREEAKTAFNKLSAGFQIASGQAKTDDLRLLGPLVSVGGAGTVDIPAQRLKFRVNPFMLASVESQSGKNNMLGFPVPIAITGPWDNPSFYPDIVGVLDNPIAAYNQLNKLGGGLISMPTDLLGIDTGEGGLVEKSIAIPEAVTKGVVGGIGQVLGVKKKDASQAKASDEVAPAEQPAAAPAQTKPKPAAPKPAAEAAPGTQSDGPSTLGQPGGLFGN